MFLRKRSWRNSFAMKLCGNCIFSITKFSEMIVFWRALRNIGNCEDVKLKYFSLWRDSSLCCASFRMTRFCFLLTIRNLNYFWNAKIFYYSYIFKGAKLAKFIRFEAGWKLYIFYHKVLGDVVKWWRFWWLWGTLEIVKMWSWNIFLYEKILHYAALRSEWHGSVFYLRLGIWIIFETQRFFIIILMFLRKQSGNSLANWWSVCFKMFFPNGFICVVASTGSASDCGKFIGLGNKMSSL